VATLWVTYWRDIPVLVTARDETAEVTVPLEPAFQELIDRVAVHEGLSDSEAYLAEWRVGPEENHPGAAAAAATDRATALSGELAALRARYLGP